MKAVGNSLRQATGACWIVGALVLAAGCSGGEDEGNGGDGDGDGDSATGGGLASGGTTGSGGAASGGTSTGGASGGSSSGGSSSGGSASGGAGTGGITFDPSEIEARCTRWNADREDMSEGTWSGSIQSCDAGDISTQGRENALKILNLYRFLADLPAITTDPARDAMAQECALMQDANGELDHDPPGSWDCFTADGATASSNSNISGAPGVESVDLYMVDPGNPTTIGHRRWILSNSIGPTGLGSTTGASCMWTLGGSTNAGKEWVAWPPPGPFPEGAVEPSWTSIDETGWTIQSDDIDLSDADVTVWVDGVESPVQVTQLLGGYGSSDAFRINPSGWGLEAGSTYTVSVGQVEPPIEYSFLVVDCDAL